LPKERREAKIANLGGPCRVDQDVVGLEVPMDDGRVPAVEEMDPPRGADRDRKALLPRDSPLVGVWIQEIPERAVGAKLGDDPYPGRVIYY